MVLDIWYDALNTSERSAEISSNRDCALFNSFKDKGRSRGTEVANPTEGINGIRRNRSFCWTISLQRWHSCN